METRSRYSTLENQQETITLKGQTLEEVDSSYLGSKVEHTARVERDVRIRLEKAGLLINGHVSSVWRRDLVSNPV